MQKVAVYITGEITAATAQSVLLAVQCAAVKKIGLRVWICSIGGDILPALAIYDALQRYPASEAIATGECQSAALVAFLGARRRLATPNTVFLHHEIFAESGASFPREQLQLPAIDALDALPSGYIDAERAKLARIIEGVYGESDNEVIEVMGFSQRNESELQQ